MSHTYAHQKKPGGAGPAYTHTPAAPAGEKDAAIPNSARLAALQSGSAKPSAEELGHRVDLPEAVRSKMEASFGADLSAVKLYQSQAVADAGAEAVTSGSSIAFAPGKLDFASSGGQALLGHELSHFVSQARGEVSGSGFLDSPFLEARADREGAMAAAGRTVYSMPSVPISTASAAPIAAPMQARKPKDVSKDADRMYQLSISQLREPLEYDLEKSDKVKELFPKHLEAAKKNGYTGASAESEAKDTADDEARTLVKKKRFLSKKDNKWLTRMQEHPDIEVMRELNRRQRQVEKEFLEHRQMLAKGRPGEDSDKLDLETAYSPIGSKYAVYQFMMGVPKDEDVARQLQAEDDENLTPEEKQRHVDAQKIAVEGTNNNYNKYLQTDEGKEQEKKLYTRHLARLKEMSEQKKKPSKKRW